MLRKILIKLLQNDAVTFVEIRSDPKPKSSLGMKCIKIFIAVIIYVPPIKAYENFNGAYVIWEVT